LQELCDVIGRATELTSTLTEDAILQRLLEVFRLMPLEDRATIVSAIEREVQARRLSRATERTTGQAMHANPHARLYVRSHETAVPRSMLERDELMLAMLSAMRVAPILLVPDIHASWEAGTRDALVHVDESTRRAVADLMREALAWVEEATPPLEVGQRHTVRAG
jgi:hypothetical protein